MAKEATSDAPAVEKTRTKYRVLKLHGEGEVQVGETGTQGVELFALLPGEYEGNAAKEAAERFGVGEYMTIPVASAKRKTAAITEPKLQIK